MDTSLESYILYIADYKGRSEITGSSMDLSDVPGVWESRSVDFIVFRVQPTFVLRDTY